MVRTFNAARRFHADHMIPYDGPYISMYGNIWKTCMHICDGSMYELYVTVHIVHRFIPCGYFIPDFW